MLKASNIFLLLALLFLANFAQSQQKSLDLFEDKIEAIQKKIRRGKRINNPKVKQQYRDLIKIVEDSDSIKLKANILIDYSNYLTNQGDLDSALYFAFQAQEINHLIKDKMIHARVNHTIGWYYHNLADYEIALSYYDKSLIAFRELNFKKGIVNSLRKTSLVHSKLGEHDKALAVYNKIDDFDQNGTSPAEISFKIFRTHAAEDSIQTRMLISEYFTAITNPEEHEENDPNWHEVKAVEADLKGDSDSKLYHLERVSEILESRNKPKLITDVYQRLGDFQLERSNLNEAKRYFEKAYSTIKTYKLNSYFEPTVSKLITISEAQSQTVEFEHYKQELESYKFNLANKRAFDKVIDQSHQIKIKEKDFEIELLKNSDISRKKFIRFLSLFLALISIMAVGLLFYFNKYRRLSKELKGKNIALDNAVNEQQTLLQETHHRVKNNLQIIASLLNLQRKYSKDQKLTSALVDGRNRVKSMALIHQLLYQNASIKGINARTYTESLISSLLGSFKIENEQIKFANNVEPIEFHEDSLLSIGLIINELATNSLKYAFREQEQGMLEVSLIKKLDKIELFVSDNGVGLPDDFNGSNKSSFGYSLINSLAKKLGAKVEISSIDGTKVKLVLSNYKLA